MQKFFAMTLAIVLSGMVVEAHAEEKRSAEYCETLSALAETVMTKRQAGASMAEMMRIAKGSELTEFMLIDAFEHPRFSTPEAKARQISDYANEWYLACIKE